jgi:hypothetical protein
MTLTDEMAVEAPEDIHASFFTLTVAMLGLFLAAGGLIWIWRSPQTPVAFWLEVVGPLLIAVAVTSHVDHLATRIGYFTVISTIAGSFLWCVADLPFALHVEKFSVKIWEQVFFGVWATSFLLFSLGFFVVAWIKEQRFEHDDLAKEHIIHISFPTLLLAAAGMLILSIGLYGMVGDVSGPRLSWIFRAVGPMLIAAAMIGHIGHMAKHIGRLAVILGIAGVVVWAISPIPLAISPSLAINPTWGQFLIRGMLGITYAIFGVSTLLLILRKRMLEKHGAVMSW